VILPPARQALCCDGTGSPATRWCPFLATESAVQAHFRHRFADALLFPPSFAGKSRRATTRNPFSARRYIPSFYFSFSKFLNSLLALPVVAGRAGWHEVIQLVRTFQSPRFLVLDVERLPLKSLIAVPAVPTCLIPDYLSFGQPCCWAAGRTGFRSEPSHWATPVTSLFVSLPLPIENEGCR
jgi:hypothetical protein